MDVRGGLSHRHDLGVRARIFVGFTTVASTEDDGAIGRDEHRADRDVAIGRGSVGFGERVRHRLCPWARLGVGRHRPSISRRGDSIDGMRRVSLLAAGITASLALSESGCTFPDYAVVDDAGPTNDSRIDDAGDGSADVGTDVSLEAGDGGDAATDGDVGDVGDVGDAESGEAGDATGCAPVRKLNFPIATAVKLGCTSAPVIDLPIPGGGGFAFARANLQLQHSGLPKAVYSWTATVEVGEADTDQIAFAIGDTICPTTKATKVAAGYGHLTSASSHVIVQLFEGATSCIAGTLTLLAGSSVDVWIEDDSPACQKKSIAVASYYKTSGLTTTFDWPVTTTATILTQKIDTAAADGSLLTFTTVEGTPTVNPNTTCGSESSSLTMQTTLDGVSLSIVKGLVPASTGQGHLVLDASHEGKVTAGGHSVALQVAKSFVSKVTTGGCCGDAMIALVRE